MLVTFSEKTSSKEEPHSDPPAAADKLDVLPPPPDGAVIADERGGKNAEISKNNPAKDEKIEVMDSHKAAQTEGKNNKNYNNDKLILRLVFYIVVLVH